MDKCKGHEVKSYKDCREEAKESGRVEGYLNIYSYCVSGMHVIAEQIKLKELKQDNGYWFLRGQFDALNKLKGILQTPRCVVLPPAKEDASNDKPEKL